MGGVLRPFALLGACALLGGCGGGIAPIASNPDLWPDTPPPPPPPPTYLAITDHSVDRAFVGFGANVSALSGTGNQNDTEIEGSIERNGSVGVSYFPDTQRYLIHYGMEFRGVGPDQLIGQNANGVGYYQEFRTEDHEGWYDVSLGAILPNLTYLWYGRWGTTLVEELQSGHRGYRGNNRYFAFGEPTLESDIPTTGSADYAASFQGEGVASFGSRPFYGPGRLRADFAEGTLTGSFEIRNGGGSDFPLEVFTMTLDARPLTGMNDLMGTVESPDSSYSGVFTGGFFGPRAIEVGGAVSMTDGATRVSGAIVGRQYGL